MSSIKDKQTFIRALFIISLLLLISIEVILPVHAAEQGNVSGTFGINAPPTVDSVTLTPISLTPQTQYTVSVQVSDPDTINDLSTVVLKLWYDSDGGIPLEAEYDAQSANVQNAAVITWTANAPGGTTYTGSAALTPASTTWSLNSSTLPQDPPGPTNNFTLTTFTFQFTFTVGKVATETTGAALWQVAAKATDTLSQTDFNYDADGAAMNWYGEITVPASTVNWGELGAGTDFVDTGAQKALGVTVTYIANGAYDEKVSSSATWTGATFTATLDATGAVSSAQQFALKANDTATYASSVLIDSAGVVIDDTGTQNNEAGDAVTTNNLWIKLAGTFNKDVYSGTVTYIITNGL